MSLICFLYANQHIYFNYEYYFSKSILFPIRKNGTFMASLLSLSLMASTQLFAAKQILILAYPQS